MPLKNFDPTSGVIPVTLEIDSLIAICIIGNIQLATRHPLNTGPSREIAENFARKLQAELVERLPQVKDLLEMGWKPEFDY